MALIVMVMTMLIGIAVDLSGQVNAKRLAGDVAAQAARVGGQQVNESQYLADGSVAVITAQAKSAALAYVKGAGLKGSVSIESGSELVVNTTATYQPVFLGAFGVGPLDVTGTARTRVVRVQGGTEK
jgi:Flp pilus assembly protein TadG